MLSLSFFHSTRYMKYFLFISYCSITTCTESKQKMLRYTLCLSMSLKTLLFLTHAGLNFCFFNYNILKRIIFTHKFAKICSGLYFSHSFQMVMKKYGLHVFNDIISSMCKSIICGCMQGCSICTVVLFLASKIQYT